jgi:hypothetical protein
MKRVRSNRAARLREARPKAMIRALDLLPGCCVLFCFSSRLIEGLRDDQKLDK